MSELLVSKADIEPRSHSVTQVGSNSKQKPNETRRTIYWDRKRVGTTFRSYRRNRDRFENTSLYSISIARSLILVHCVTTADIKRQFPLLNNGDNQVLGTTMKCKPIFGPLRLYSGWQVYSFSEGTGTKRRCRPIGRHLVSSFASLALPLAVDSTLLLDATLSTHRWSSVSSPFALSVGPPSYNPPPPAFPFHPAQVGVCVGGWVCV